MLLARSWFVGIPKTIFKPPSRKGIYCRSLGTLRVKQSSSTINNPFSNALLDIDSSLEQENAFLDSHDCHAALSRCQDLAKLLPPSPKVQMKADAAEPTNRPLSNGVPSPATAQSQIADLDRSQIVGQISHKALSIALHPSTTITSHTLELYVNLQSMLQRPESFPHVFDVYASQSMNKHGLLRLTTTAPASRFNLAVPLKVALLALDAAIEAKNLSLCLNIISTTAATSAYRRMCLISKGLFPLFGLSLTPLAAYILGQTFSQWQERLDSEVATAMGTIGFLTYFSMTALLGYVTITTANDQMRRVTWVSGTPLATRWIHEDERRMVDRVAQAWGFQDPEKFGEENSKSWNDLRIWIQERGMVLDNPTLLGGMD